MATSKVKRLYCEPPVKIIQNINKTMNKLVKHKNILLIFILWLNISLIRGQMAPQFGWTRDPRWYSREGVDYKPPDPGDPNYRCVYFLLLFTFSIIVGLININFKHFLLSLKGMNRELGKVYISSLRFNCRCVRLMRFTLDWFWLIFFSFPFL